MGYCIITYGIDVSNNLICSLSTRQHGLHLSYMYKYLLGGFVLRPRDIITVLFSADCAFGLVAVSDRANRYLLHHTPPETHTSSSSPFRLIIVAMADTQQAASASAMPPGVTDPNYKPLPGRLGNLSVPQQHALDTLKAQLREESHFVEERMDDATLLRLVRFRRFTFGSLPALTYRPPNRFLRARKFDIVKTKEMLLSAEQWRKDFGVEEIMKSAFFSNVSPQSLNPVYHPGTSTSRRRPRSISITRSSTTKRTRCVSLSIR